jgi:PilZ domain
MTYGLLTQREPSDAIRDRRQRRYHRQTVHNLAYVNVDQGNGGIVRDVSETGIAIQAVAPLQTDQQVFLRFDLLNPRLRIDATGRVAWADSTGQAGIEFLALPQRSRRLLKDWIFGQVLVTAEHATRNSIFHQGERTEELHFSSSVRDPIRLAAAATAGAKPEKTVCSPLKFAWCPFPVPRHVFPAIADGTVILFAVLFFFMLSGAIAHSFPAWPIIPFAGLSVTGIFAALYWYLFREWIGATPGTHFMRFITKYCEETDFQEDDPPRFR